MGYSIGPIWAEYCTADYEPATHADPDPLHSNLGDATGVHLSTGNLTGLLVCCILGGFLLATIILLSCGYRRGSSSRIEEAGGEERTPLLGQHIQSEPEPTAQARVPLRERVSSLDVFRGFTIGTCGGMVWCGLLPVGCQVWVHKRKHFSALPLHSSLDDLCG